jgi:type IV pilus assembly protein PilN
MIKINLAQGTAKTAIVTGESDLGEFSDRDMLIQAFLRLIILMLGPLALYLYEGQILPEKTALLSQKQQVLASLMQKNESAKNAVEEVKKFEADRALIQAQIDIIDGLKKEKMREIKILDLVQKDLPEKMWLTKLEYRNNEFIFNGFAGTDGDLTQFMDTLSKSIYVKDVNLKKSADKVISGSNLKEFSIITKYALAEPTLPAGVKK